MNENHHQLHLARTVTEGGRNTHIIHWTEFQQKRKPSKIVPTGTDQKIYPAETRVPTYKSTLVLQKFIKNLYYQNASNLNHPSIKKQIHKQQ